jgi:hypothetical protein
LVVLATILVLIVVGLAAGLLTIFGDIIVCCLMIYGIVKFIQFLRH